MRIVPGANPALCSGNDLTGAGPGPAAGPLGSRVRESGMAMARPQEEHRRALSEHNAPQPAQVIMRTDCIPLRRELVKPYWSYLNGCRRALPFRDCSQVTGKLELIHVDV